MSQALALGLPMAVRTRTTAAQDACWCGQVLDAYAGGCCPRCGTRLHR